MIFGELFAVAAILMCLAFVTVDLEAWDSPLYFLALLPLSVAVAGVGAWRFGGPSGEE